MGCRRGGMVLPGCVLVCDFCAACVAARALSIEKTLVIAAIRLRCRGTCFGVTSCYSVGTTPLMDARGVAPDYGLIG